MEIIIPAVCGVLGILITKIFDLVSQKKKIENETQEELNEIKESLNDLKKEVAMIKKDDLRTQLMVMIKDFPTEKTDILRLGQHYFEDLHGNWVLTNIFSQWLINNEITIPHWLPKEEKEK